MTQIELRLLKRPIFRVLVLSSFLFPTVGKAVSSSSLFISPAMAFASKEQEAKKQKKASTPKPKKQVNKNKSKKAPADGFYKNSTLEKIYKRQAKRMKRIDAYKKKGIIGEADNGMLKIRQPQALNGKAKAMMEKVVKVENSDRTIIIREIEKGISGTAKRKAFVRRRLFELYRQTDPRGTYFFQADHWNKK